MNENPMPATSPAAAGVNGLSKLTGDAFGAGIALVVGPGVALFFGVDRFASQATMGLPVLAIFGIMMLFGALSLVATLFQRLNLTDPQQALALPAGSIRAAIALSLIVLFAIISIMLYRSMSEPYKVKGLSLPERKALVDKAAERIMASIEEPCAVAPVARAMAPVATASGAADAQAGPAAACAADDQRFTVHLRPPAAQESTDLAKQLLILVGTLMTSVTSFYFAARNAGSAPAQPAGPQPQREGPAAPPDGGDLHADGCDVDITDPTPDEALPAASGGVAR